MQEFSNKNRTYSVKFVTECAVWSGRVGAVIINGNANHDVSGHNDFASIFYVKKINRT